MREGEPRGAACALSLAAELCTQSLLSVRLIKVACMVREQAFELKDRTLA